MLTNKQRCVSGGRPVASDRPSAHPYRIRNIDEQCGRVDRRNAAFGVACFVAVLPRIGATRVFLVTCCMCVVAVVPRSEILELSLVRPCLCQIAGQAGFACRLAASRSNALSRSPARQHSSSRCLQRGKIETRSSHARVITDQQAAKCFWKILL